MHENLGAEHVSTNKELWFLGVKLTWEKDQYLFYFMPCWNMIVVMMLTMIMMTTDH